MKIRRATAADVPIMVEIERLTQGASHWPAEKYQEVFTGTAPVRIAFVVEKDGIVRGFLVVRTLADEWEIENIAVAEGFKRRGLGSLLLTEALTQARSQNIRTILLEVRETNRTARNFYNKFSFTECGVRKDYYHNPNENAVIYSIHLQ